MKNKILCCLGAGILMMGLTTMPMKAKQAVGTEDWTYTTDYTKPLLSPGEYSTQLHISWYSEKAAYQQGVKITKKSEMQGNTFPATASFFSVTSKNKVTIKNGESYYANKAKVQDLIENTAYMYSYTLGDGVMSEPQEYRTKSFDRFQLMYVGDPQIGASGNAQSDVNGWVTTMNHALQAFPNISQIISVGDQTNASTDVSEGNIEYNGYCKCIF